MSEVPISERLFIMRYQFILWVLFLLTTCSTLPPSKTIVSATVAPTTNTADPNLPISPPTTSTPVALSDAIGQPIQGSIIAFTVNELTATMGVGRGNAPRGGHFYRR